MAQTGQRDHCIINREYNGMPIGILDLKFSKNGKWLKIIKAGRKKTVKPIRKSY